MAFQASAASGQQQQRTMASKRRMQRGNLTTCGSIGLRCAWELRRIDTTRNHPQPVRIGSWIVLQNVLTHRVGDTDHALTASHHLAVPPR